MEDGAKDNQAESAEPATPVAAKKKRPLFQIHLLTVIVLTFTASALLPIIMWSVDGISDGLERRCFSGADIAILVLVACALLLWLAGRICEHLIRRRERRL